MPMMNTVNPTESAYRQRAQNGVYEEIFRIAMLLNGYSFPQESPHKDEYSTLLSELDRLSIIAARLEGDQ